MATATAWIRDSFRSAAANADTVHAGGDIFSNPLVSYNFSVHIFDGIAAHQTVSGGPILFAERSFIVFHQACRSICSLNTLQCVGLLKTFSTDSRHNSSFLVITQQVYAGLVHILENTFFGCDEYHVFRHIKQAPVFVF